MNTRIAIKSGRIGTAVAAALLLTTGAAFAKGPQPTLIEMTVSKGAAHCLPLAKANVSVVSDGSAEDMYIYASGLPANTDFDFFVIQVPNAPFGLAWYQGDVETDAHGNAFQHFRGRFSIETFVVAVGAAPAPDTFPESPFPDATVNPVTNPVQMYHLGMWFNSPKDAEKAGCPALETPFNGEHDAGIQVLNTASYPELQGPLLKIKS
jgi:hypothetical protein